MRVPLDRLGKRLYSAFPLLSETSCMQYNLDGTDKCPMEPDRALGFKPTTQSRAAWPTAAPCPRGAERHPITVQAPLITMEIEEDAPFMVTHKLDQNGRYPPSRCHLHLVGFHKLKALSAIARQPRVDISQARRKHAALLVESFIDFICLPGLERFNHHAFHWLFSRGVPICQTNSVLSAIPYDESERKWDTS